MEVGSVRIRLAAHEETAETARIYNEGIDDRSATFEISPRTAKEDILGWFDGVHSMVVVEEDDELVAFAPEYRTRG